MKTICPCDHSFISFAKFCEKLIFLTPGTYMYLCISRGEKC